jgi:hypothetical protein
MALAACSHSPPVAATPPTATALEQCADGVDPGVLPGSCGGLVAKDGIGGEFECAICVASGCVSKHPWAYCTGGLACMDPKCGKP